MKNIKTSSIALLVAFFALASCEDILEVEPQDSVTEIAIYADINQTELILIPIYNNLESWAVSRNNFWGHRINIESASFEAKFKGSNE